MRGWISKDITTVIIRNILEDSKVSWYFRFSVKQFVLTILLIFFSGHDCWRIIQHVFRNWLFFASIERIYETKRTLAPEQRRRYFFDSGYFITSFLWDSSGNVVLIFGYFFQTQHNGAAVFIQLLPILLLIVLSMLSSLFISDPVFSLQPSSWVLLCRVWI